MTTTGFLFVSVPEFLAGAIFAFVVFCRVMSNEILKLRDARVEFRERVERFRAEIKRAHQAVIRLECRTVTESVRDSVCDELSSIMNGSDP